MEKNIFENAYFGMAYKTRDGRKGLYIGVNPLTNYVMLVIDNFEPSVFDGVAYYPDGTIVMGETNNPEDIVSEWHGDVNINHLEKLAKEYSLWLADVPIQEQRFIDGFEEGYKAAKRGE